MADQLIEAPERDAVVVFDGLVLEIFAMDMSRRYYGSVDPASKFWFFDESQRAGVEALVAAVPAA